MIRPLIHSWLLLATLISLPAMAQKIDYQFGVRWSVNGLASSVVIRPTDFGHRVKRVQSAYEVIHDEQTNAQPLF
ncbi:hypothetical protein [Vreelandella sp. GE22]